MTRGRKPVIALREAEEIGGKRGRVIPTPGKRGDSFDLIIHEDRVNVYVRVKRSISSFIDSREILAAYRREIVRLRKIPLTIVVVRELWIRLPRGEWQFFRILVDRIAEIREDGTIIEGTEHPMPVPEPFQKLSPAAMKRIQIAAKASLNPGDAGD
jgi:hypothetical protein